MAADDPTIHDDTTQADDQAETAGRDARADHDTTQDDTDVARLKAENERLKKAQQETNRKAAADRKFREDIEREREEKKAAQMTEAERLRKELEESRKARLEAEAALRSEQTAKRDLGIANEIEREATRVGFIYPEDVPDMLRKRGRFDDFVNAETDEIDRKRIKESVERLAKDREGLLTARRGGGTPTREQSRRFDPGPNQSRQFTKQIDPYEQELNEMGRGGRM